MYLGCRLVLAFDFATVRRSASKLLVCSAKDNVTAAELACGRRFANFCGGRDGFSLLLHSIVSKPIQARRSIDGIAADSGSLYQHWVERRGERSR